MSKLEIERKYLVAMPDLTELYGRYNCQELEIEQYYVSKLDDALERRFRRVKYQVDETLEFYYCEKKIIHRGVREEKEIHVTEQNYEYAKRWSKAAIRKIRTVFTFDGRVWELDVYSPEHRTAILEVEVNNPEIMPRVPRPITVIRDVTHEPEFSNRALAERRYGYENA